MSYIDIGIIVIVALCALIGLKRGLFKSLMSLFGWLITFAAAFFLTKIIAYALLDIGVIGNFVAGTGGGFSLYTWVNSWEWLGALDTAPAFILTLVEPLMGSVGSAAAAGMFTVAEGLSLYIAYYMYCIMVFAGLFIVIKIVVGVLLAFIKTLGKKDEKPRGISRLLGFVVSAVKGGVYVVLLLLIFSYVAAIPQLNSVGAKVEESMIGAPVYTQVKSLSERFLSTSDEDTIKKLVNIAGITPTEPVEENDETGGEDNTQTENAFDELRQELQNNYDQIIAECDAVINSESATEDEKNLAGAAKDAITQKRALEADIEERINDLGYERVIVVDSNDFIYVIVDRETLTEEEKAAIVALITSRPSEEIMVLPVSGIDQLGAE